MSAMSKPFRKRKRIAVVGTFRSGKTVLLSSLINHIQVHDDTRFRIGSDGSAQIRKVSTLPLDEDEAPFPYEANRDALIHHGTWPVKTRDSSHHRMSFERTDWKAFDVELHLFDFPGERIADVAVAVHESYDDWCDHVLGYIATQKEYRDLAQGYVAALEAAQPDEAELKRAYKEALASFILNYKPMITPSTFLLDPHGTPGKGTTPQEVATGRFAGLEPDETRPEAGEFVPLTRELRETSPEMTQRFRLAYEYYRNQVVQPLFRHLSRCHHLVVVTDVTTLLAGGTGMFNDNLKIVEDLFRVVRSKGLFSQLWESLLGLFGGIYGRLERVAFVATKLDLVAEPDRSRLRDLLREMTRHIARDLDVPHEWFTASAIVSTQVPAANTRKLVGRLVWDPQTGERLSPSDPPREYTVSEMPERWPGMWGANEYSFPTVYPRWPQNKAQVPDQIGLDALFEFLLS